MVIDGRPKCTYGCMNVGVLNRRGAMEIIVLVTVEDLPPSEVVHTTHNCKLNRLDGYTTTYIMRT